MLSDPHPSHFPVQLTIRRGFALAFGAVLGLLLLVCSAAWVFLDDVSYDLEVVATDVMPQLVRARNLVLANESLTSTVEKMTSAGDDEELLRLHEFSRQSSQQLNQDLQDAERGLFEPKQLLILQQIHRQIDLRIQQMVALVGARFAGRESVAKLKTELLNANRNFSERLLLVIQKDGLRRTTDKCILTTFELTHKLESLIYELAESRTQDGLDLLENDISILFEKFHHQGLAPANLTVAVFLKQYLAQMGVLTGGEASLLSLQRAQLDNQAGIDALQASCLQLSAQFRLLTTVVVNDSTTQVENVRAETKKAIAQRKQLMVIMLCLSLATLALIFFYIAHRRMVRPLSELTSAVATLEQGGKPPTIRQQGVREIQKLTQSFEQMAETISRRDYNLRQLHLLLRSVIDSLSPLLLAVDQGGRVTLWNLQAVNYCGETLAEGQLISDVLAWLPVDFVQIEQAVKASQPLLIKQLKMVRGDQQRNFELSCTPLVDEVHQGAVLKIEEVTERLQIAKALAQSEKMLSIGGLAAGIAHEINNPLAGIMQNAQVLENRLNPALSRNVEVASQCGIQMVNLDNYLEQRGIKKMLQGIRSSASQAAKIVENMLEFSRGSRAVERSGFEKVDLADLIDKTLALLNSDFDLRQGYDFRQVRIERNFAASLPLVSCEGALIQQVIFNILKNCAQAFGYGWDQVATPCVRLLLTQAGETLKLVIEDNGPGMTVEVKQRIFEPFYTTKEVGQGTGLGMSVSYYIIVDHHLGTIDVESEPGQGSRFIIGLPIEQES